MYKSFLLFLITLTSGKTFEFHTQSCGESSIPQICHVKIIQSRSKEIRSHHLTITFKISQKFQQIEIGEQDLIDRQVTASKMRHQLGTLYGMDQSSMALLRMMSSLSDKPRNYEQVYRQHKKRQLETFELFRNSPETYAEWVNGRTIAKFATDYWDDNIQDETFLTPAVQVILYDEKNSKAILRSTEDGTWTLLLPEGEITKIRRKSHAQKDSVKIELPFKAQRFSFALLDESDRILDHLGKQDSFSHKGAYLILQNFEVLPRLRL